MGVEVFIALGSNLDDPSGHIQRALPELGALPRTEYVQSSRFYRSAPLGPAGQPDYINAVAKLETGLFPEVLLAGLQAIERSHGRVRGGERWGPRPLDLDLLLYGTQRISRVDLQVPHPRMAGRAFVLCPLHEIAGDIGIPGHGSLSRLLEACSAEGLEIMDEI